MHAIQDHEVVQMRELSSFLDLEINFVEQYLNVLKDVKSDWRSGYVQDYPGSIPLIPNSTGNRQSPSVHAPPPRANGPVHIFKRSESVNSKRSGPDGHTSSESAEEDVRSNTSRKSTLRKRRASSSSKPPSRSSSRATSRKRAESVNTDDKEKENDKEKERERTARMSVADWASSAVGSVTGRSKKGKEKFTSLNDSEAGDNVDEETKNSPVMIFRSLAGKLSREKSLNGSSPKAQAKILKPPSLQDRKVATALYNFNGGSDELSFQVGDVILVLNEVLEGWWLGELDGKKGLFPTTHVEVSTLRSSPPVTKPGKGTSSEDLKKGMSDDDLLPVSSDLDDDNDLARKPLSPNHHTGQFYSGLATDAISINSSCGDDDDYASLMPRMQSLHLATPFHRRETEDTLVDQTSSFSRSWERQAPQLPTRPAAMVDTPRKAPPPPPPRRYSAPLAPSPPVPPRSRAQTSRTITPASSVSSHDDRSPFESTADLQTAREGPYVRQNPFQANGMLQ